MSVSFTFYECPVSCHITFFYKIMIINMKFIIVQWTSFQWWIIFVWNFFCVFSQIDCEWAKVLTLVCFLNQHFSLKRQHFIFILKMFVGECRLSQDSEFFFPKLALLSRMFQLSPFNSLLINIGRDYIFFGDLPVCLKFVK